MAKIYLVGMMGSGKSVTGKALAGMLRRRFIDMDSVIEEKAGNTIEQIFEINGEFEFRNRESAVLQEAAESSDDLVVATGGGVVLREENVEVMKKTGKTVYLKTSPDILWARIKDSTDRPLLLKSNPYERLQAIYQHRERLYEACADYSAATDGLNGFDVADNIRLMIESES